MKGGAAPPILVEAKPVPIVTDAERLRSALINVLTNARQASTTADQTGAGADRPIVLTAARAGTGQIRVTVRDHGPGIAPEHLAHVFEPYYTTRRAGTGLGLAITRNIVEGLGGNISVQSASPGTIVQIDLPAVIESPVEATRA
jgi:signal transduction histidine kinase